MSDAAPDRTLLDGLRRHLAARGGPIELIETHISWVLLAGDDAYKLKKPVRMGFLDFTGAAARQRFCEEELRLNRRLAPALYLDVLPVRGTPGAPQIGGRGPVLDHVLHMRRFPPGSLLSERLAAGTLQDVEIDRLADRIAAFHDAAPVAAPEGPWGTPEAVLAATRGVLGRLADEEPVPAALAEWFDTERFRLAPQWRQRLRSGRIREGHGDLHLANALCLPDGEVTAFDCLEFDPALRWIDVIDDAAFMMMDLLAHGRQDLAWRFMNGWLDATGDHAGLGVLRGYLVHRALVRALVARLRHAPAAPGADDYLALAQRLTRPDTPRLLLTHGLSGSGKSHAAARLAGTVGAVRLRSDVERKRLFGLAARERSEDRVPGGVYGPCATARTYDQLLQAARTALQAGWNVIVDAAFLRRCERDRFHALALDLRVPFALLDCQAPLPVLRERVAARLRRGDDASEADLAVLEAQRDFDEPLAEDELRVALTLRTDRPWDPESLARRWPAR
ncbi:MAG: AAA family ATPase [Piscinibacter sp.]|nr:AAA family ATPase [Piscinibacter sp.]